MTSSDCTICFEDFAADTQQAVVALQCGHLYHRDCIQSWIARTPSHQVCPKCSSTSIHPFIPLYHDWNPTAQTATTQLQQQLQELKQQESELQQLEATHERNLQAVRPQLTATKDRIKHTDAEIERIQALLDTTLVRIDESDSNVTRYKQIQQSIDVDEAGSARVKEPVHGVFDFESMDSVGRQYSLILLLERLRISKQFGEAQGEANKQRIQGLETEVHEKRERLLAVYDQLRHMHELQLLKQRKKQEEASSGFASLFGKKKNKRASIKQTFNHEVTPLPPELDPTQTTIPLGEDHAQAIQAKLQDYYKQTDDARHKQREAILRLKDSYLAKIQANLKSHMRHVRELLIQYDKHKQELQQMTLKHEAMIRDFDERKQAVEITFEKEVKQLEEGIASLMTEMSTVLNDIEVLNDEINSAKLVRQLTSQGR